MSSKRTPHSPWNRAGGVYFNLGSIKNTIRNKARGKPQFKPLGKADMSDRNLRKRLIRLAHSKPELRSDLLPLLQKKAYWKAPRRITKTLAKQVAKSIEKPWTVQTLEEVRRAISKTILSKMSMSDMISYQKEVGDWANSLPDADLRNLVTWVYEAHYRGRQKGYTIDVERLKSATKTVHVPFYGKIEQSS